MLNLTFSQFIAQYEGDNPEILTLKADYKPLRGRNTEKSLVARYGVTAHAAWAAFVAAGGK